MKLARDILVIGLLLLTGAALMYVIEAGSGLRFMPGDKVSPSDFISIILTALGVILAALALVLGGLAIVGWATFEEKLKHNSDEFLKKRFSAEDQRYIDLINEIKEDVRREIQIKSNRKIELENQSPFDPDAV